MKVAAREGSKSINGDLISHFLELLGLPFDLSLKHLHFLLKLADAL
jgi:hypothetical protein